PIPPLSTSVQPPPPPRSTLFPYTTLFRAGDLVGVHAAVADRVDRAALHAAGAVRALGGELEALRRAPLLGHDEHRQAAVAEGAVDRKSTRLHSSHVQTSYDVFCLKKKD